jgi:hypothetical protein
MILFVFRNTQPAPRLSTKITYNHQNPFKVMNKPFNLLIILSLIAIFFACNRETEVIPSSQNVSPFFVRDVKQNVVHTIEPSLLQVIHKDLIKKGRQGDADNLLLTYDSKSGNLLEPFETVAQNASKSGRTTGAYTVSYDAHVADKGWLNNYQLGEVAGTKGQKRRMEAFRINTNPINYGIRYCAHVQDLGWQPLVSTGETAGTTGKKKRLEAFQIVVDSSLGTNVFYRAYIESNGWSDWVGNGQVVGTTGRSRQIEAYQLTMFVY